MKEKLKGNKAVIKSVPESKLPAILVDRLTPFQQSVHNNFLVSVRTLKTSLIRTIYYLGIIKDHNIHRLAGFSTIGGYTRHVAGLTPRQTREFLFLARKLPEYPIIERALAKGELTWAQAREICASTVPEDQQKWLDAATLLPREELRRAMKSVAQSPEPPTTNPGIGSVKNENRASEHFKAKPRPMAPILQGTSRPAAAPDLHYLTLKFTSEQKALWERLLETHQKKESRTKEEVLLSALAADLNGSARSAEGRAPSPLMVILMCPECGNARLVTNKGEAPVDNALLQAAHCDGIIEDLEGKRRSIIPPRLRRLALRRARYCCEAKDCGHTQFLEVHHRKPSAQGGPALLDNLVVLCSSCHRASHRADIAAKTALKSIID